MLFSPKILRSYQPLNSPGRDKRKKYESLSKWDELYRMGLEKPKLRGRREDDILIEREKEEYTFKPNLSLTENALSPVRSKYFSSNYPLSGNISVNRDTSKSKGPEKMNVQSK